MNSVQFTLVGGESCLKAVVDLIKGCGIPHPDNPNIKSNRVVSCQRPTKPGHCINAVTFDVCISFPDPAENIPRLVRAWIDTFSFHDRKLLWEALVASGKPHCVDGQNYGADHRDGAAYPIGVW